MRDILIFLPSSRNVIFLTRIQREKGYILSSTVNHLIHVSEKKSRAPMHSHKLLLANIFTSPSLDSDTFLFQNQGISILTNSFISSHSWIHQVNPFLSNTIHFYMISFWEWRWQDQIQTHSYIFVLKEYHFRMYFLTWISLPFWDILLSL